MCCMLKPGSFLRAVTVVYICFVSSTGPPNAALGDLGQDPVVFAAAQESIATRACFCLIDRQGATTVGAVTFDQAELIRCGP